MNWEAVAAIAQLLGAALGRFAFAPAFVAEVDELLARTAGGTYLRDMRTWDNA
jgi:hypothetical protein